MANLQKQNKEERRASNREIRSISDFLALSTIFECWKLSLDLGRIVLLREGDLWTRDCICPFPRSATPSLASGVFNLRRRYVCLLPSRFIWIRSIFKCIFVTIFWIRFTISLRKDIRTFPLLKKSNFSSSFGS